MLIKAMPKIHLCSAKQISTEKLHRAVLHSQTVKKVKFVDETNQI